MEKENHSFAVLGLDKNASLDDVKNAYRKLAMRYHPDRNSDCNAAQHFQMVRAAYELLKMQFENNVDLNPNGMCHKRKKQNLYQTLWLSLKESFLGTQKNIVICKKTTCATCLGSGKSGLIKNTFCKRCLGSGKIFQQQQLSLCPDCSGKGLIIEQTCKDCLGLGVVEKEVMLSVNVPKGVLSGDELRLSGQGEIAENENEINGDLYLNIVLKEDAFFRLENRHLHCDIPVSFFDFIAGHCLNLPFFNQNLNINIAPFQMHCCLENYGFPAGKKEQKGNLYLHFTLVYPQNITPKNLKLLKKIAQEENEENAAQEVLRFYQELKQHLEQE